MKTLFALGAVAVAAAPLLWSSTEGEKSCCGTTCDAAPATLAAITVPAVPVTWNPDSTGSILVKAKFDGDVPEPLPPLTIDASKSEGCDAKHAIDTTDRSRLIAKDGAVANVVVTVEIAGQEPKASETPVVIDQSGCRFEPHVSVVPIGSRVQYKNSDGINHNVHTFAKKNDALNRNIAGGSHEEQLLSKDEAIEVKCDIHPWMKSWLVVTEAARYGVTAADGTFKLEGLPPGEYKVKYWHETLGKGTSDAVTVSAGGTAELAVTIGEKKSGGRGRR